MVIKKLDWDSAFFHQNIVAVYFENNDTLNLAELKNQLTVLKAQLVYCFVPEDRVAFQRLLEANGAILVDKKLTFSKQLVEEIYNDCTDVYSYVGELNTELISLSIEAGQYSRFKLDTQLHRHFEEFYTEWIYKSVKRENADEVFVYYESSEIKGMITCRIKDEIGNIGLVATEQSMRGKGIGKKLVNAAESYFNANGITISRVITQKANDDACQFYQGLNYKRSKQEYVYHWWIK